MPKMKVDRGDGNGCCVYNPKGSKIWPSLDSNEKKN